MDGSYIVAFCFTCNAPRYRSTKPLVIGTDHVTPDLFTAVDPEGPPPARGSALCYVCGGSLRFVPEEALGAVHRGEANRAHASVRAQAAPAADPPLEPMPDYSKPLLPERSSGLVRELFRVANDEQMINVKETPEGLLLITNKRVVLVQSPS